MKHVVLLRTSETFVSTGLEVEMMCTNHQVLIALYSTVLQYLYIYLPVESVGRQASKGDIDLSSTTPPTFLDWISHWVAMTL
jgi:hypothetical protein